MNKLCLHAVTSIALAACSSVSTVPRATPPLPAARGSYLQIVAHQDDDLLFMNPDLQNTIRAGRPTTTVYLTAGEARYLKGEASPVDLATCHGQGVLSREQYADCRQQGIRNAYALMAGASVSAWKRTQLSLDTSSGPRLLELDSLALDGKQVALLFLDLPDAADEAEGLDSLERLWSGSGEQRSSIVPAGGVVRTAQRYDRETLLQTLTAIMQRFSPTVVRVQDLSPDVNYRFQDHGDHIAAARLGAEAFDRYSSPNAVLSSYRDYNINNVQANLEPTQVAEKNSVFRAYAAYDREIKVGDVEYERWPARLYHRFWTGTQWVVSNLDGRLQAFAVLNRDVITWEQRKGGWQRRNLGHPEAGRLAPSLAAARNADGRLEVFALSLGAPGRNEIYSLAQTAANGGWAEQWTSLGTPNDTDNLGVVSVGETRDGRLQLFVKNGNGGVSTRKQAAANGGWSDWLDLGGAPGVQDGLAVITTLSGRIELFAYAVENGAGLIKHWYQAAPNAELTADTEFPAFQPASPPTVATDASGRLHVYYRLASSESAPRGGQIGHSFQIAADGGWSNTPEILAGYGGVGPIAAVGSVLLQRNRSGGISTLSHDISSFVPHEPAVAVDAKGRVLAFVLDGEGNLVPIDITTNTPRPKSE